MFGITKKEERDPGQFWRDYEAQCGEKVLAFSLGRYISGWTEYELPLWGLLIATDGGFRFHHFPHEGWIQALSRISTGGEQPKEKTIFIPRARLLSAELRIEKSWWKKLLLPRSPLLVVRYGDAEGTTETGTELILETEEKAQAIVRHLNERMQPEQAPPL